jgi:anti-sigma factor RsiW
MDVTRTAGDEMACIELVELVTDYFEGALSEHERQRFEEHLAGCGPCVRYVEQLRTTVELSGRLDERDVAPELRTVLLEAFRGWRTPSD